MKRFIGLCLICAVLILAFTSQTPISELINENPFLGHLLLIAVVLSIFVGTILIFWGWNPPEGLNATKAHIFSPPEKGYEHRRDDMNHMV